MGAFGVLSLNNCEKQNNYSVLFGNLISNICNITPDAFTMKLLYKCLYLNVHFCLIPLPTEVSSMSSRRKRAPPVRVDDETKKKLDWNMHEDRRSEAIILDDDHILSSESSLVSSLAVGRDDLEASCSNSLVLAEPGHEPSCSSSEKLAPFRLALGPASDGDQAWRALLGEFYLSTSSVPVDLADNRFVLQRSGDRLSMFPLEDAGARDEGDYDQAAISDFPVECSLAVSVLEDLEWLQRRRIIQLCHKQDRVSVKVTQRRIIITCTEDLKLSFMLMDFMC